MSDNLCSISLLFQIAATITCPVYLKILCAIIIVHTELYVCIGHDLWSERHWLVESRSFDFCNYMHCSNYSLALFLSIDVGHFVYYL